MIKLILTDLSVSVLELEDAEITIKDRAHPERTYVLTPKGGYIHISADYAHKTFNVDTDISIPFMEMRIDKDQILKQIGIYKEDEN